MLAADRAGGALGARRRLCKLCLLPSDWQSSKLDEERECECEGYFLMSLRRALLPSREERDEAGPSMMLLEELASASRENDQVAEQLVGQSSSRKSGPWRARVVVNANSTSLCSEKHFVCRWVSLAASRSEREGVPVGRGAVAAACVL